ncbi:MAG TPA: hypothetical protein VFN88_11680 [Caulobacteraceae bacterium]|nr:hypothetical protein [Caulobacteraceae bacterium]
MAQAARKTVSPAPQAAPSAAPAAEQPTFRLAADDDIGFGSPALDLQNRLGAAVLEGSIDQPKWSYRKTAAFLLLVNGAFWASVGFLVVRFVF